MVRICDAASSLGRLSPFGSPLLQIICMDLDDLDPDLLPPDLPPGFGRALPKSRGPLLLEDPPPLVVKPSLPLLS